MTEQRLYTITNPPVLQLMKEAKQTECCLKRKSKLHCMFCIKFYFHFNVFLRTTLKSSTHVFSIDFKWILVAIMQDHSSWICNYNGNLKQMRKFHIVPNVISIFFKHSPGVIKIIFAEGGVIAYFEVLYQLKLEHNLSARKWLYWDGERNIILQTQVTDQIIFGPLKPKIWLLILHFSC